MSAKERLKAAAYSSARLGTDKVIPLADAVREIETLEAERDGWRDSAKRMADKCDDLTQELQAVCRRTNILRTAVVTAIRSLQGSGNTDRTLRTLESILERLDVSEAQTQSV